MSKMPSDIKAAEFRDKGSAFYRQNKFFDALVCYNISLCFSETKQVKSLTYANRSAVYLESKKFQQCLDNIQLAREHEYPDEKLSRLEAREVKCKQLMEQHRPDSSEDPWNFFKLSYPANKKLPFIVECLELREDAKYGRHIVTNRDLKPGDIIAIEDPFFKHLYLSHCYERCNNCLKSNMLSLIPCKGRCVNSEQYMKLAWFARSNLFSYRLAMFCSEKCAKAAESRHRQYECSKIVHNSVHDSAIFTQKMLVDSLKIAGGIKKLQACIEKHEKLTIFDIDLTNPDDPQVKKKQLMAFLDLKPHPASYPRPGQLSEGEKIANRLDRIKALNNYPFSSLMFSESAGWKNVEIGLVISLFGAFFNHSCDPNVNWYVVDNKLVAVVQVPIKAGEQLFNCYKQFYYSFPILLREERRELLLKDFHFICDCNACHNDLKVIEMRFTDKHFEFPPLSALLSPEPFKEFKKNCKYIEKNIKKHRRETIFLVFTNIKLLEQISQFGSLKQ